MNLLNHFLLLNIQYIHSIIIAFIVNLKYIVGPSKINYALQTINPNNILYKA